MKKLYMTILTLFLVFSMSVTAFAAESPVTNDGSDSTSISITGSIVRAEEAGTVISVVVAWDAMDFTYTEGKKGEWLPDEHKYADDEPGTWSDDQPMIILTNHSNSAVSATFGFESKVEGLVGTFTEHNGTENDNKVVLATAEGTAYVAAPYTVVSFGVSGSGISADQSVGTITVAIAAASDADVPVVTGLATFAALQAALDDVDGATELTLASDIFVPGSSWLRVPEGRTVSLDLNGYSIYALGMHVLGNYGTLILNDSTGGGGIYQLSDMAAIYSEGYLQTRGGTYSGDVGIYACVGTVVIDKANIIGGLAAIVVESSQGREASLIVGDVANDADIAIDGVEYAILVFDGATAEIRGGMVSGDVVCSSLSGDAMLNTGISITGGIYDCEPRAAYVEDGYIASYVEELGWIIQESIYD